MSFPLPVYDFIDDNFFFGLYDIDDICICTFDSLSELSSFTGVRLDHIRYALFKHSYIIYNNKRCYIHYFYKDSYIN